MITHEEARQRAKSYRVIETSILFDYIAQQEARDAEIERLRAELAALKAGRVTWPARVNEGTD